MVLSLKANKKRIIAFILLAAIVVGACIFLKGGDKEEKKEEIAGGTNEERVAFLESFGWQVEEEPMETREVMIPAQFNDVYTAYNVMQKTQGFDLKPYAGEVCTQYKYKINNYPNEPEVYATLLVCGNLIVGGDVACAEVDGFMHGFAKDSARYGETGTQSESSQPMESEPAESGASMAESENTSQPESQAEQTEAKPDAASQEGEESTVSATGEESVASTAGEVISEEDYPTD